MQHSTKSQDPASRLAGLKCEPKVSPAMADDIRREYVRGSKTHGMKALAEKHKVSIGTVHGIIREYRHVPSDWGDRPRSTQPRYQTWPRGKPILPPVIAPPQPKPKPRTKAELIQELREIVDEWLDELPPVG